MRRTGLLSPAVLPWPRVGGGQSNSLDGRGQRLPLCGSVCGHSGPILAAVPPRLVICRAAAVLSAVSPRVYPLLLSLPLSSLAWWSQAGTELCRAVLPPFEQVIPAELAGPTCSPSCFLTPHCVAGEKGATFIRHIATLHKRAQRRIVIQVTTQYKTVLPLTTRLVLLRYLFSSLKTSANYISHPIFY